MEQKKNTEDTSLKYVRLNNVTIALLVLAIFSHAMNIIKTFTAVCIGLDKPCIGLYSISASVIFIALAIFIIKRKPWAVVSFFVLQFLNAVGICIVSHNFSGLGVNIFVSFVMCCILCLILLLRVDGISGWKAIFHKSSNNSKI